MIGKTNASGSGVTNPIIVNSVADINKLTVKNNIGKVFKYVGETFYPQDQVTPIVEGQPFTKLYINTQKEPTVEEVYSWCDGGGSSGEPVLFGITAKPELGSGESGVYQMMFCSASNDQTVNACLIIDYASFKGIYFMTSDGKFPDDPQLAAFGFTKLGWNIGDGIYTKASFGLSENDPAYITYFNKYYDLWKDYFSTTPFPKPWVKDQLYEIVDDNNEILAKPIYILDEVNLNITPDKVISGYQGYNDIGNLISGEAYEDLAPIFLVKVDQPLSNRSRIDTIHIPAIYPQRLSKYAMAGFTDDYTLIIRGNIESINYRCFYDSDINIEWEVSDTPLSLNYNSFENYKGYKLYLPYRVNYIGSDAFASTQINSLFISDIQKWFNINFDNESSNPLHSNNCKLYLVNTPAVTDTSNEIKTLDLSGTNLTQINNWVMVGCYSIQSVTLPATIQQVGEGSFKNCTNLTEVTFNSNIQTLNNKCFWKNGGQKLSVILSQSTPPAVLGEPFNKDYINSISVPAGSKTTYIADSYWATLADLIQER